MRTEEVNFDVEGILNLISSNSDVQIRDNAGNYSDEWLTLKYINGVFDAIKKLIHEYKVYCNELIDASNSYQKISEVKIPSYISELLLALGNQISGLVLSNPTTEGDSSSSTSNGNHDHYNENPDQEEEQNPDQEEEQNPDQEQEQNPDQEQEPDNNVVENETLIAASVGAIAFQTPITLYSTIGGESVQTSSETEYGILGVENVDGTLYYKVIDKKTGKVYYAKKDDVKVEEKVEILHTKNNTLVLNSTDVGSDDNLVKVAEPDSYYIVTEKQENNGVTFATVLDSETGKKYYVPVGDTVEIVEANQLGIDNNNNQNTPDPNLDIEVDDGVQDNNNSENYSDDDIDINVDDDTSSVSDTSEDTTSSVDEDIKEDSESEYLDNNNQDNSSDDSDDSEEEYDDEE